MVERNSRVKCRLRPGQCTDGGPPGKRGTGVEKNSRMKPSRLGQCRDG